jgi:uncharacterized membrane protein YbhN (UPF0104 family)
MAQRGSHALLRFSREHSRAISLLVTLGTTAMVARAVLPATVVTDVGSAIGSWMSSAASALTWTTVLTLSLIISLQYVAAALSARAAAGVALPFRELVATQIAATAANSLTPVGLGGVTVTGRYYARRGRLQPSQAAAAVSALAVFGGAADILAFALLIGVGSLIGVAGASGEVPLLVDRLVSLVPRPSATWIWGAAVIFVVVLLVTTSRLRRAHLVRRAADGARAYRRTISVLVRRPGRMSVLMSASASTTLLMAAGFAAIATLGPAALPVATFGAVMIGYMVASAAGNAVPTPGGIGTADAAFTGVLVAAHVPLATAIGTVLAYRLITFWAPVVLGAVLIRPLRRRGAL